MNLQVFMYLCDRGFSQMFGCYLKSVQNVVMNGLGACKLMKGRELKV